MSLVCALMLALVGSTGTAGGQGPARTAPDAPEPAAPPDAGPASPPPVLAPPAVPPLPPDAGQALPVFLAGKKPLDADELADKEEGAYFTGLPLIDSDPDTGFGFGASVFRYWDGPRSDPFFRYAPYQHRLTAQAFFTTNGYQYHSLEYDAPYVAGSAFRLRGLLYYEKNIAANYFGRGPRTLGNLSFPGAPGGFGSFDAYSSALEQLQPGGVAYTRYDKFSLEDPGLALTVERDFFGGIVRVQAGLQATYARLHDYSGDPTRATDPATGNEVTATMARTRLAEDCQAGLLVGCQGGKETIFQLGVAFDTRDYEPDPNVGVFADLKFQASTRALRSDFDFMRLTASPRFFYSPFPKLADLVFAARAVYSIQTGVPFFDMNGLAFTDGDRQGLGGLKTLRGFKQDRFVGNVAALVNFELRWSFVEFRALDQNFGLSVAPFLDLGRVFDRVQDFTFRDWQRGQGAGLRVAWNKATIIVLDVGFSREDWGLYMDFNHQF